MGAESEGGGKSRGHPWFTMMDCFFLDARKSAVSVLTLVLTLISTRVERKMPGDNH